jgi:hypothetical protein
MKLERFGLLLGLFLSCVRVDSATLRYVNAGNLTPTPPFTNWATAASAIQDAVDAAGIDDQILVTNGLYASGGRIAGAGLLTNRVALDKRVTLRSVNGPALTIIQGWQVPGTTNGDAAVRCVYLDSQATLIGFMLTNGATRTGNVSSSADYSGGGAWCDSTHPLITNCIVIGNSAAKEGGGVYGGTLDDCLVSANVSGGASSSILNRCLVTGNSANAAGGVTQSHLTNCVLMNNSGVAGGAASDCVLDHCTLVANSASSSGGGAYSSTLLDCSVIGNSSAGEGGGAWGGALKNCVVNGNSAATGGGAAESSLTNCTVVGNRAAEAGGVWVGNVANSIVYYNEASVRADNVEAEFVSFCCTTPLPTQGSGNIANEPLFVNLVVGDFNLQTNSPCINSGNNSYVTTTTDLQGDPRIQGGTVDIGAFELQKPPSVISYAWLKQYGLASNGSADFADSDGDGMNNWQEWLAGTDPTSNLSALKMEAPSIESSQVALHWQSEPNRIYFIQKSTNLTATSRFEIIATNICGNLGTTSYIDTNLPRAGFSFYRIGVQ